jgi:hypothetical protein
MMYNFLKKIIINVLIIINIKLSLLFLYTFYNMDIKKIINIIEILKKYINNDELKFIIDGITQFITYDNMIIEYSIKHIYDKNEHKIENRIGFGIKYNQEDHKKYFDFMNIDQIDIKDYKDCVYFGYDKSNNVKRIYFEKIYVGLVCYEYINNKLNNIKNYHIIKNISNNILNFVPESLRILLEDKYSEIFYFTNKNLHIYQFKLNYILNYNDDFNCAVISLAFDNDNNIKYHTYYLRFKDKSMSLWG